MPKDLQCILVIVALCLFIVYHISHAKHIAKPKQKKYDKTIYKPRKRENKGLPDGDFTHGHVDSMWDEIE